MRNSIALFVLIAACLFGQQGGNVSSAPPSAHAQNDAFSGINTVAISSLVVYGNVTMASGAAPGQLVMIERVCGGLTQTGGFADSKGRFSFDLGVLNSAMGPGSMIDNASSSQLATHAVSAEVLAKCFVRASLAGYHTQTLPLESAVMGRKTALGAIVLKPFDDDLSGRTPVDAGAPKTAKKNYEKGLDAAAKAKWQEAIESFQKAVSEYPKYASAWLNLGLLQAGNNQAAAALQSLNKAIEADEKFALPYMEAATLESMARDWEKTSAYAGKAIALAPNSFPRAYLLSATAHLNLRNLDQAEKNAAAGLRLDGDGQYPDLEFILGIALLGKMDVAGARAHLETYLKAAPGGPNSAAARLQLEKLKAGS